MMIISKSLRLTLAVVIASVFLLATGCSGGSGGGGDDADDGFPTPTLPAGAAKFDAGNANAFAVLAVGFVDILDTVGDLKTAAPPSIPDALKLVTDQVTKRNRSSSLAANRTEDISAGLCVTGTAIANSTETANSESGTVTFTACDVDGIVVNGSLTFVVSENDTTLDYSFQIGGTLTFSVGTDLVTIVMNLTESGNEGTGAFTSTISFSLAGIPGGGFLVTTTQAWVGNALSGDVTSGQLIIHGSDNTRISITVVPGNMAEVHLDDGLGGGFMYITTIPLT